MPDPHAELTGAMLDIYRRAAEEENYHANYLRQMIEEQGGYDTAMQLIHSPRPTEGYTRLWGLGRLDLAVEALILSPAWRNSALFTDADRRAAYNRLLSYHFTFPEGYWSP